MADATLPGLLLTGDHASRPGANTVGTGALYACSTHDLIYQSDGSAWSTWSDVSGAGGAAPPDGYAGGPITSAVTMVSSGTWYDSGASDVFPAGDFILSAAGVFRVGNAGATAVIARLIDTEGSPTVYAGGIASVPANAGQEWTLAIMPRRVTLAGSRTIKLQFQDVARANSEILDTPGSGPPATDLNTGFVGIEVTSV